MYKEVGTVHGLYDKGRSFLRLFFIMTCKGCGSQIVSQYQKIVIEKKDSINSCFEIVGCKKCCSEMFYEK